MRLYQTQRAKNRFNTGLGYQKFKPTTGLNTTFTFEQQQEQLYPAIKSILEEELRVHRISFYIRAADSNSPKSVYRYKKKS